MLGYAMSNSQTKRPELSKEAQANALAGKAKIQASKNEAVINNDPIEQYEIDLEKDLAQLMDAYDGMPQKLVGQINTQQRCAEMTRDLQKRIGETQHLLSPGRDALAKGLATKLSPVQRTKLRHAQTKNKALLRRLVKSDKALSKQLIQNSKTEMRSIRLNMQREKVRDPHYYVKYGDLIIPAFERTLASPMTRSLHTKLKEVKSSAAGERVEALARVLLAEVPELYIRSTGNKELKAGYFTEFVRLLMHWNDRRATIK